MLPHSADGVVDGVEIFEDCRPGLNGLGNSVLKVCHSDPYISQALLYNSEVVAELVDSILEADLQRVMGTGQVGTFLRVRALVCGTPRAR